MKQHIYTLLTMCIISVCRRKEKASKNSREACFRIYTTAKYLYMILANPSTNHTSMFVSRLFGGGDELWGKQFVGFQLK